MNTLSNVNLFCKAVSEPMLEVRGRESREKLSSLHQFSGLLSYLLRVKQMEIKISDRSGKLIYPAMLFTGRSPQTLKTLLLGNKHP